MSADPIWKGVALDAATALALLDWQREMGVDEPMLDAPVDRYAESARPPVPAAAAPTVPPLPLPETANDLPARAAALAAQLVASLGTPLPPALLDEGGPTHLFPTPDAVAGADEEQLPGMPGARRRALRAVTAAVAGGELDLSPGADRATAREGLLALPGVGPWTADIVALRGLGDPDVFPGGDLGLRASAAASRALRTPVRASVGSIANSRCSEEPSKERETSYPARRKTWIIDRFSDSTSASKWSMPLSAAAPARCSRKIDPSPLPWCWSEIVKATSANEEFGSRSYSATPMISAPSSATNAIRSW